MSKKTGDFSGNKGEWSEVYVFLKLLADAQLQGADANGDPMLNYSFKVLKAKHGIVEAATRGKIVSIETPQPSMIEKSIIKANAKQLYLSIRDGGKAIRLIKKGVFLIPKAEPFLRSIGYSQLKVAGVNKRDITVQTKDTSRGQQPYYGYSIKSEIGQQPSLLNASKSTNLIFELGGLSTNDISIINSINGGGKIIKRCEYIKKKASNIQFVDFCNPIFKQNLEGIDDGLPDIIAACVKAHYFENCKTSKEAIDYLQRINPRKYSTTGFYETKYKRFLRSVALGMEPATAWDDIDDATGGYIIAKPDGKLVAFFLYDRKLFDTYLYTSTFFERGSTGKHHFMQVYKCKHTNKVLLKLNLQIRFKSQEGDS